MAIFSLLLIVCKIKSAYFIEILDNLIKTIVKYTQDTSKCYVLVDLIFLVLGFLKVSNSEPLL